MKPFFQFTVALAVNLLFIYAHIKAFQSEFPFLVFATMPVHILIIFYTVNKLIKSNNNEKSI